MRGGARLLRGRLHPVHDHLQLHPVVLVGLLLALVRERRGARLELHAVVLVGLLLPLVHQRRRDALELHPVILQRVLQSMVLQRVDVELHAVVLVGLLLALVRQRRRGDLELHPVVLVGLLLALVRQRRRVDLELHPVVLQRVLQRVVAARGAPAGLLSRALVVGVGDGSTGRSLLVAIAPPLPRSGASPSFRGGLYTHHHLLYRSPGLALRSGPHLLA